ncbi:MAG: ABC transporter substrate-binding protein [Balneolaceae bacterium]
MKLNDWIGLLIFPFILSTTLVAQDRTSGIEAYEDHRYEEALEELLPIQQVEEQLFAAKSALALGRYDLAADLLNSLDELTLSNSIQDEARYTLALVRFRQKDPLSALHLLYPLMEGRQPAIRNDATNRYREFIDYLSLEQIRSGFRQSDEFQIRLDLTEEGAQRGGSSVGQAMIDILKQSPDRHAFENQLERLESNIRSMTDDPGRSRNHSTPPEGMVYHIGVALPSGSEDQPEESVSRQLYSGLILAAEEHNRSSENARIQLRFRPTASTPESAREAMHRLIWQDYSDLVIGPLFTDSAIHLSRLSEQYQVPLITPLANTGHINAGHHYTFQLNADLALHGERMAQQAVQVMGLDTLAVFTQSEQIGRDAAVAFRREAERLGAYVAWFIDEPYRQQGFDLSPILDRIFPHTAEDSEEDSDRFNMESVPGIDGVYAPFSGEESETLASMLLTELEGRGLRIPILGSQIWSSIRYTDSQNQRIPILYSRGYRSTATGTTTSRFVDDFQNQFGFAPNEFAYLGYDTGRFLIGALSDAGNPDQLHHTLRAHPPFSGLILDVEFGGDQMNQRVQILPGTSRASSLPGMDD